MEMLRQRRFLGILGILLPIVDWISAVVFGGNHPLLPSISSTYYMNSSALFVGLVFATGVFLIFYEGYDIKDFWLSKVAGAAGITLVLFPCYYGLINHNFLMIPMSISNVVHLVSALIFFGSLFWIIEFQFTKGKNVKRNRVYKICGWIMLGGLVFGFGGARLFDFDWFVYLGEAIALWAFGIAWLIKGQLLMKDKN